MIIQIDITTTVEVPDGSKIEGQAIILPSGDQIKPWVAYELNEGRDLDHAELEERGIHEGDTINRTLEDISE